MKNFELELDVAINLAFSAGRKVMGYYKKPDLKVWIKEDGSPVTEADLAANEIIAPSLRAYFSYAVLSEEEKDNKSRLESRLVWCIDPIDGTKEFIKGTDNFAVMIGLIENKKPILGVVYLPTSDKMYYAVKNEGAHLSKDFLKPTQKLIRLSVSNIDSLAESSVLMSSHNEPIKALVEKMKPIRYQGGGGFGYKICHIAEGNFDSYLNNQDNKGSEWDSCAPHIILEEAGGKLTDFNGNELTYNNRDTAHHNGAIASNGILHEKILKFLAENK
ncbi:3'(2'),5'-bisphosphate nucleotidase CysQ [Candidatus Woesearchaeota archaeon]|nr:3'(2'),5'-bisphosphate nucleotidase CysQ [Candidatus Woesearchaeota archaeon]